MKKFRSIRHAARMTRQIILIALPLFIARAVPASAEPVTWYLTGVSFAGGGSATGWLVYNATTLSVTNWDITVTIGGWHLSGTENPFTFTPANSVAYNGFASLPHDEAYFLFQTPYEGPPNGVWYELTQLPQLNR